ncbi:MAG TPA: ABC transporter ATP-binding protein [Sulfolobales archaeon]|nr:ABC transporter ATP-binding protein [Sulfolobales archaeon]
MLELKGIVKRYGAFELAIDSIVFEDNRYYIVLGPSGSGKTTLLRLIAGLEVPDMGDIIMDGRNITFEPPWRRNIGIVFQNYALYPHMTAFENIAVPLRIKKIPGRMIRDKVIEIARLLEIEDQLNKYPHQMSGGQQQRVAIARALVKEPRILLLDEPLSNLDARLRIEVRGFLKKLQRRIKTTIIHVTHDQEEALAIADEIILLNKGRIVQKGSPEDIYRRPRDIFTFTFIGLSNLVPAEIFGHGDRSLIGFRPEDAYIEDGENYDLEGVVEAIEYLGSHSVITIRINDSIAVKVRTNLGRRLSIGERVRIRINRDRILRFYKDQILAI